MTTYKYQNGSKQLFANHMENVESVSFRETMINFHASSIAPVIKAYFENDKNYPLPVDDNIIGLVAFRKAKKHTKTV